MNHSYEAPPKVKKKRMCLPSSFIQAKGLAEEALENFISFRWELRTDVKAVVIKIFANLQLFFIFFPHREMEIIGQV